MIFLKSKNEDKLSIDHVKNSFAHFKFLTKIHIFEVKGRFLQIFAFFEIDLIKIYLIGSNLPNFENHKNW